MHRAGGAWGRPSLHHNVNPGFQRLIALIVALAAAQAKAKAKADAENKAKLDAVKKGMTLCLESKGYTLK